MKNLLGPGVLALTFALSTIPVAQAAADIMEGDHLVIFGGGRGVTSSKITGVQGYDFDRDGIADNFSKDAELNDGTITSLMSLQYYYHWSQSLAFGLNAEYLSMKGTGSWDLRPYTLSGGPQSFAGSTEVKSSSLEFLPTVRYSMLTHRRVNPYLFGGIGLNNFTAASIQTYSLQVGLGAPSGFHPRVYDKSSIGLAATFGAGTQIMVMKYLLAGIEGRWTYCQIDKNSFGRSSWTRLGGYLWVGTKWNAPL